MSRRRQTSASPWKSAAVVSHQVAVGVAKLVESLGDDLGAQNVVAVVSGVRSRCAIWPAALSSENPRRWAVSWINSLMIAAWCCTSVAGMFLSVVGL